MEREGGRRLIGRRVVKVGSPIGKTKGGPSTMAVGAGGPLLGAPEPPGGPYDKRLPFVKPSSCPGWPRCRGSIRSNVDTFKVTTKHMP